MLKSSYAIPMPQTLSYKSMLMLFVLLLESSLLSFAADAVDPSHTCFTKARETRTANPPPAFSVNFNLELEIFILFTPFFFSFSGQWSRCEEEFREQHEPEENFSRSSPVY